MQNMMPPLPLSKMTQMYDLLADPQETTNVIIHKSEDAGELVQYAKKVCEKFNPM